jgi:hypothetical protein
MENIIKERIQALILERNAIETQHNAEYRANQKANQDFQQKATENQTRYAQLTGAIAELQKLLPQPTNNNHDNLPTTPSLHNRTVDVCPVEQSQDR